MLLTLHAKARRWFQFGGHCEPGDATLAGAALREAIEESGLADLRARSRPDPARASTPYRSAVPTADVHHLDVRYSAVADRDAEHAVSEESLDVRWWPVDDVPNEELEPLVALALAQSTSSGGGSTCAAADQPSR